MKSAKNIIRYTLSYLNNNKAYVVAFKKNVIKAFELNLIQEDQFKYMNNYANKLINKIELYENLFSNIKKSYHLN
ncbi:hypothetical protein HL033_04430 [Neoehrlichia mikurensis]|uniref:hypothetical protein n=1 Tax=Neoehrlichia mikurensis TaxID=89586 RepID=UPI001C443082|nr:hypothetical protein [Neoehrlichia mikurensis]QXK91960.1 hypothetical protein IAH97_04430 [Neoehrlichia mikurensis]QXK93174.1 hypothetical protein HUN61_04425 [Neoehrlichia mikurensis]QXK93652.1 hypothetical protein HL033_04430 [Neoehrlichia mikurensis]